MDSNVSEKIHATCVEVEGLGILLRGPSGCGKSDLALRLIDDGARLIADDYAELSQRDGRLSATALDRIEGLIEVRGVGILKIGAALRVAVGAVIDLVDPEDIDRMPEDEKITLLSLPITRFRLTPFESSAPAKVRLIARLVKGDIALIS